MTVDKSKMRANAIHDVGSRLDDELEKAKGFLHQSVGAVAALDEAAKDVAALVSQVQARIDDKTLDGEVAKEVINWIEKAGNTVLNLRGQSRNQGTKFEGVVTGLTAAVSVTSKMYTVEETKAGMVEDQLIPAADPLAGKKTIKQLRLEEAASKPAAKKKAAKKKVVKKKRV